MTNDGTNTLTYDNNGNLTSDGTNTHTWDKANRLLSVGTHSYAYDGNGARIQKTVSSIVTDYVLDVQRGLTQVLAETTGANTNHYIHSPRGIHAMNDGSNWSYMLQDGLGSVRAEIAQNVAVNGSQSYAPYGEVFGASGAMSSPFAFTGEPLDGNGLQYHRARYMNPALGGFLSLDPFEGLPRRPMSLNGYSWVEGNTINSIDPDGRQSLPASCGVPLLCDNKQSSPTDPKCGCKSGYDLTTCLAMRDGAAYPTNGVYNFCDNSTWSDWTAPCCGPDATKWIHQEMVIHTNYAMNNPDLRLMGDTFGEAYQDTFLIGYSMLDDLERLAVYGLAVDYGYVDYRSLAQQSASLSGTTFVPQPSGYSCSSGGVISVCGRCQNSTDYGNFILGMAIQAAGFAQHIAEASGIIFNMLSGDTSAEADNQGVVLGYLFNQSGGFNSAYNREEFCSALTNTGTGWLDTLPSSGCSKPCTRQNLDNARHSTAHWQTLVSRSTGSNSNPYNSPAEWLNDLVVLFFNDKLGNPLQR